MASLKSLFIVLSFLLLSSVTNPAQSLELIISPTRLPTNRSNMVTGYDGNDSIYLIGSIYGTNQPNQILKYSISTSNVSVVSQGVTVDIGSGAMIGNGDIFYFGGRRFDNLQSSNQVLKFERGNLDTVQIVNQLRPPSSLSSSVWDSDDAIYIIGGRNDTIGSGASLNTITKYSIANNSLSLAGQLPTGRTRTSSIWDQASQLVYIFGGHYFNDILEFNPATGLVTKLNVSLSKSVSSSCAVWTGTEAYIIGGYESDFSPATFFKFTPSLNEVVSLQVDNFPQRISSTSCTFVPSLNRIYIIGGEVENSWSDLIMYVDL